MDIEEGLDPGGTASLLLLLSENLLVSNQQVTEYLNTKIRTLCIRRGRNQ